MTPAPNSPRTARRLLLAAALLAAPGGGCGARSWQGRVVGVADGTTLTVIRGCRPTTIRLHGVGIPPPGQPLGRQARQLVNQLVHGQQVRITEVSSDRRGRTFATVRVGSYELRENLLLAGLAWHRPRHDPSPYLADLERQAMQARRGIWARRKKRPGGRIFRAGCGSRGSRR